MKYRIVWIYKIKKIVWNLFKLGDTCSVLGISVWNKVYEWIKMFILMFLCEAPFPVGDTSSYGVADLPGL
jgi:hypothetical protein